MGFARSATLLALGLLAACREPVDGRGQPEIYRGPLTIVAKHHAGETQIRRSEGARSRITWNRPGGYSRDSVDDGLAQRAYSWSSTGPDVEATYVPKRAPPRYWLPPDSTEPLGGCAAAGESGRIWRYTSPPNFKNPEARITDACLTRDGVMIAKYAERFPNSPSMLEWEATSVVRGPLAPDTFVPPPPTAAPGSAP